MEPLQRISCPACAARLKMAEVPPGKMLRCPKCGEAFTPEIFPNQSYSSKPAAPVSKFRISPAWLIPGALVVAIAVGGTLFVRRSNNTRPPAEGGVNNPEPP